MAYTYDDFISAARNAGLYDSFSQEDLATAQTRPEYGLSLLKLQQDASKASTEEQKLLVQEAVNQLRNTYGTALPEKSFTYGNEDTYQMLLGNVSTPGSFAYDHRKDGSFGALKNSAMADNDRTKQRLLGQNSVPQTSWAGNAAQQSGNYYDARVNDLIPTMNQNAYQEYLNGMAMDQKKLGAISGDKEFNYAAYLQQIQLDQAKAQQEFDNAMTLNKNFGTRVPTMPDLDSLSPGENTAFTYDKANEYQDALNAVVNQEAFSYAQGKDPLYGSARKTALREGDRQAADILAQINARTGGMASSYGVRAAADAANAYNEELSGSIPGLRQTAYQEYLGDFEGKLQGLQALESDRQFDYAAWLQDYQLQEAAKQQEFQNALAMYKLVGLTPNIAAVLGVPYVQPTAGGYTGEPKDKTEDETAYKFVDSMLESATKLGAGGSAFNPSQVISGTSALSQTQKETAQAYLAALLDKGYMK